MLVRDGESDLHELDVFAEGLGQLLKTRLVLSVFLDEDDEDFVVLVDELGEGAVSGEVGDAHPEQDRVPEGGSEA